MSETEGNGAEAACGRKCLNPLCGIPIQTRPKASHPRKTCSNECKLTIWALRRVAEMLLPLGQAKGWEILKGDGG